MEDVSSGTFELDSNRTLSINEIILEVINNIRQISTTDMREGYVNEKIIKTDTGHSKVSSYVPDGRKSYINAVNFLTDITWPMIDEQFKTKYQQYQKKLKVEFQRLKNDKSQKPRNYIDYKLEVYRKIFKQVILLINRIGLFESKEFGE